MKFNRIVTEVTYPDDEMIDVFWAPHANEVVVTDLGETVRWLKMQDCDFSLSRDDCAAIKAICQEFDCEFRDGMISAVCEEVIDVRPVADAVTRAARMVAVVYSLKLNRAD